MSEKQLSALLAKLKEDPSFRAKLQSSADLNAGMIIAQQAGFDVSKLDWLNHQAMIMMKLNDQDLETIAGGINHGAGFTAAWTDQCLCR